MRTKPGKLYRRLPAAPHPMFSITAGTTTPIAYSDDTISTITINHGGTSPIGTQVATCEVTVPSLVPVATVGTPVEVRLTDAFAAWIASISGATASVIAPRYRGRAAGIDLTDHGKDRYTSSFVAAHWLSLESRSRHTASLGKGTWLNNVIRALLNREGGDYTMTAVGEYDALHSPVSGTWSEWGRKLVDDLGLLLTPRRDGSLLLAPLPWRLDRAYALVGVIPTLIRSQVLAPSRWRQPIAANDTIYRVQYYDAAGVYREGDVVAAGTLQGDAVIEEVDWTWLEAHTDQWVLSASAMAYRGSIRYWTLPAIEVDLLALLTSAAAHDRRVAGHLLSLNVGDFVALSGDWLGPVRGMYAVTGISEHITGNEWRLTISIAGMIQTFGKYPPHIPADVWASADYSWDSALSDRAWG